MRITVNGKETFAEGGTSVQELLVQMRLDSRKIAVERNLEIVAKSAYQSTMLEDGDQLEIVHFIGGGQ